MASDKGDSTCGGSDKNLHVDGAVKAVELELTEAETCYLEGGVCSPCPYGRHGTEG